MEHIKQKIITGSGIVALAGMAGIMLYGIALIAFASGLPHEVAGNVDIISTVQKNATSAHESLGKARDVTRSAIEAERTAQGIVDGYTDTVTRARKSICQIDAGKYCTREYLDPMNTQVNLEQFFLGSR